MCPPVPWLFVQLFFGDALKLGVNCWLGFWMGVIPFAFRHCVGCEVGQQWGATPAHRADSAQGCKPEQGNASAMSIERSHYSG